MSEKLQIFNDPKFDNTIVGEEIHTYHPHTKSFDNSDIIEISINQHDAFISLYEADICISGELEKLDPNGSGTCELTQNFAAYLFESISYELNGKEVDKTRDPGLTSTIKGLLTLNENESKSLDISGWCWKDDDKPEQILNSNSKFTNLRIPLRFLLGVFDDYRRIISGRHKIVLVRARTDDNCYLGSVTAKTTEKAKIVLHKIELKVKHIIPNDVVKLRLMENLNKDKPILIPFRRWEIIELPSLPKTTKEVWNVKTCTSLQRPRYIIVAFQIARKDQASMLVSQFDHLNIISIKAFLNSEIFPFEGIRSNFTKDDYTEAYLAYLDFQRSFLNKTNPEPLMDYKTFKKKTLYVIDTTKQSESIQQSTVDLKIEFESSANFPDNTRAYCLVVHDCIVEYRPLTGIVKNLI